MSTPKYDITFSSDGEWLEHNEQQLRLRILHTPGHTPDSLAIYDEAEHWLFTGDSFYLRKCILPNGEDFRQPIIFGELGNWTLFERSCKKLLKFVDGMEITSKVLHHRTRSDHRMRIACAHDQCGAGGGSAAGRAEIFQACCGDVRGADQGEEPEEGCEVGFVAGGW